MWIAQVSPLKYGNYLQTKHQNSLSIINIVYVIFLKQYDNNHWISTNIDWNKQHVYMMILFKS